MGAQQKQYAVHKKLLCDKSKFFDKAFNGAFKESTTGVMDLPTDDPVAFNSFVNWLYRGTLMMPNLPVLSQQGSEHDKAVSTYFKTNLVPTIVLAEKLGIPGFINKVMDYAQDAHFEACAFPDAAAVNTIYNNTLGQSKARIFCASVITFLTRSQKGTSQYLVDFRVKGVKSFLQQDINCHHELLKDLLGIHTEYWRKASSGYEARSRDPIFGFGTCFFHEHTAGEVCYLK